MARLFIGLDIHEPLVADLEEARGGVESAHWQRDNQLHLTLAFIGDASRKVTREIEYALAGIRFEPFELSLEGVGMFGKPKSPKALWAGVANKAPLHHLHGKIAAALERIDVDVDRRKYKPHVTLARFRRGAQARVGDWLTSNERLATRSSRVESFVLFSSERTSEGSFYRPEAEFHALGLDMSGGSVSDEAAFSEWLFVSAE